MKKLLLCLLILPSICMAIQYSDQYWAQDGIFALKERASAPSAATGWGKIFTKSADNALYFLNSAGSEFNLLLGGSANLDDLGDVIIDTPLNNQSLVYETATGKWKNKLASGYTFSAPLSESLGTVSISQATTSTNGYLSSTDWNTFNGKQAALGYTAENVANKEDTTMDNSTTKYPTNNLVKTYVDTLFSAVNPANHNDLTGRSDASAHPSSAIDYGSSVVPTAASTYDIGSLLNPWNYIYGNFARFSKTSTNSTDQIAKLNQTSLSTNNGAYGSQVLEVYNAIGTADSTTNSSGVSAAYFGAYRNLLVDGTNGNGTLASLVGISVDYGHGARETMATGTTTSAYGLYVTPRYSSGTITNMYDIFIANPVTGGTVTNKYGIYQESTAKNYFAGNVGVGTNAPSEKLDVKGTVAISGATSGAVKFAVPAAAGSATYTLPSADGAASSVLSTNGSGTLSWVSQTAGDAFKSTGSIYNGRWSVTVGSSNLTIALKNQAGNDPSAGDPVKVVMRTNAGASRICTISSAKSLVVTNGSSLGTRASIPHVLSIYLVDISASNDCTSVEVGVSLIRKIDLGSISTTAEGGSGGADLGTALYTTTAASSKQAAYVGNILITPAAGFAWTNAPTKVYLPGDSAMNDPVYAYTCRDSSNQTVTNGTETTVAYNTRGDSIYGGSIGNGDTKNALDTSTGIYTVVDPGLYRVDCQIEYNFPTGLSSVEFWMKKNTSVIDYLNGYENSTNPDSTRRIWKLSSTLQLAAGDTIKCTLKPYGANVALTWNSCGLTGNFMQIVKLDNPGAL